MKLGILGGTFDPIHFGHLRAAEEIREELDLEKILFIPGALPPHKDRKEITPFQDRVEMVRLALSDSSSLVVLDLEGRRKGPSYSVETLREIRAYYKNDIEMFFIIGVDAFKDIETWKEYKDLFKNSHFVVINRPGISFKELGPFVLSLGVGFEKTGTNSYKNRYGNLLIYKKITDMDISSTKIRDMISAGKSIRFLVPQQVIDYIVEKGLYNINGFS